MNYVICDDNIKDLEQLSNLLKLYFQFENIVATQKLYSDAKKLLDDPQTYDIYFMDIVIDKLNGIEVSKLIKKNNPQAIIILVSNSAGFALDGYKAQASRYLLKPIEKDFLYLELHDLMENFKHNNTLIPIGKKKVTAKEILYLDKIGRSVAIHFQNKTITEKGNISEWVELLKPLGFEVCYKGVLVNLSNIARVSDMNICLKNNEVLPISRRNYKKILKAYHFLS